MALNVTTLKTRTVTAIIFAAIMLIGLFYNVYSFLILFTMVHFGCWYEFIKLAKKINNLKLIQFILLGFVYITIPILMLFQLSGIQFISFNNLHFSYIIPCCIIFSIWVNDTMAYFVGSIIGKTPFSKISPKKTWEGTIGGVILCVLAISLVAYFTKILLFKNAIIISLFSAIFGTVGDLFESKLKRQANVKDSGSFMPGHGGFLDRFDSLLFAVPAVWIFLYFLS